MKILGREDMLLGWVWKSVGRPKPFQSRCLSDHVSNMFCHMIVVEIVTNVLMFVGGVGLKIGDKINLDSDIK